ncbi:glutathione hydrolase 6 isoform X2 [Denticeps clupeoides]|nr:glutathione hydrolase 6 isoform X2 [Denticeps clupeoides]
MRNRGGEMWLRLAATLVLLCIVVGFVLCEWNGCGSEPGGPLAPDHSTGDAAAGHLKGGMDGEGHSHGHHDDHHDEDADGDRHDDDQRDQHHSDPHGHSHSGSLFHHGVILTDSDVCSRVGKELLEEGGNVIDGGIAALLCLAVVHPHTAGVGGALSAIFYNQTTGSVKVVRSAFPGTGSSVYGVPGVLQGLKVLHTNHGRSTWRRLFQASVALARHGFTIDELLATALKAEEEKIVQSGLCDLFCDADGGVKSRGSNVTNPSLSALLQAVSLNDSHFPEMLANKLAEDLADAERSGFVQNVLLSGGEISDPIILEKEKYSVLWASPQLSASIVLDVLEKVEQQSHSLRGDTLGPGLLNLARDVANSAALGEGPSGLSELLALNTTSSHVNVMDSQGNFLIVSSSLNSSWGSAHFLPSSGVVLSDFVSEARFAFPLVLKVKAALDDEAQVIAVTGGLSALFNVALIATNWAEIGMSASEAVHGPLIHLGPGDPVVGCVSSSSDGADVYRLLAEGGGPLTKVGACTEASLSVTLQLLAGHVRAYGAPLAKSHTDGY